MNRLGFSDREASWLSFGEYYDLYREYQKTFDIETRLRKTGGTYQNSLEAGEKGKKEKPLAW